MLDRKIDYRNELGKLLLKKEVVEPQILERALRSLNGNGKFSQSLAQVLVNDFKFEHDKIYSELAELYAFKKLEIEESEESSPQISRIVKFMECYDTDFRKQLIKHKIIPFCFDDEIENKLVFGAVDPTDPELPKVVNKLNLNSYEIAYLPPQHYKKVLDVIAPKENEFLKNIGETEEDYSVEEETSLDENLIEVEINKSALVNLFEGALIEGVRKGVSDIHFIPASSKSVSIFFRLDGKLKEWHKQEHTMPEAMVAVIKDRSRGLNRFEREIAQDGFIQREVDDQIIRFRVSILPTVGAEFKNKFERVVIRILDDRKIITDLEKLGLDGYSRERFNAAIKKPQGMVILTGPTGCGKSTTLVAALHQVIDPSVNVLTVEDPVEYVIKGAAQLKISHKMDFEQALRSILRHDPDIVLVGEIRDRLTADIAIKLANTGHLTFSTLHTNDAASAVARLYKMGIEPFLLASAINIIVAQRLVRKLCSCKKRVENLTDEYFTSLDLNPEEWHGLDIYEANGCKKCLNTGFQGRLAIHEALNISKEIKHLIYNAGEEIDEDAINKAARKDGTLSLRASGFEKVKQGLTSFNEVITTTMED